jgi:osmotically-inducible protein OsmY
MPCNDPRCHIPGVGGVKAVANDIEVRLPSAAERTDADIAAAATRTLEWNAFVPIERLDVTVSKGWIIYG